MKPESLKVMLRSFLEVRQQHSAYDDFDGVECPEFGGEPFDPHGGIAGDLSAMLPHSQALSLDVLNVPLPPEDEKLCIEFGRQLSEMSDEFELGYTSPVRSRSSSTNESRIVQFKKHIIHVPPTCEHVQIPVTRTKAANNEVTAKWRTCDKSAKAGLHYAKNEGSISFAPSDKEKTIEVEIIRDLDRRSDIHFAIELYDDEGTFNTLMVYIQDDSKMEPSDRSIVANIFNCRDITMSEIVTRLSDNVTHNTFKAGLLCLSCCADSMPTKELALGFELLRQTTPRASLRMLTSVLTEFYSYLPELGDLVGR